MVLGEQPNPQERLDILKELLLHHCWELVHTLYNNKDLDKMVTLAEVLKYLTLGMKKEDEDFDQDLNDWIKNVN